MNSRILYGVMFFWLLLSPAFAPFSRADELADLRRKWQKTDVLGSEGPKEIRDDFGNIRPVEHSSVEVLLSVSVLIFGVLVMAILGHLAYRDAIDQSQVPKLIGLTLVVSLATFLIPAGYAQAQIAPVIGLLGTVAGYLFGRSTPTNAQKQGKKRTGRAGRQNPHEARDTRDGRGS